MNTHWTFDDIKLILEVIMALGLYFIKSLYHLETKAEIITKEIQKKKGTKEIIQSVLIIDKTRLTILLSL